VIALNMIFLSMELTGESRKLLQKEPLIANSCHNYFLQTTA